MRTALLTLSFLSFAVVAQDVDVSVNDDPTNVSVGAGSRGYESSTGNRYQYDMSNPADRVGYDVDVDAQMRDSTSIEPTRDIDRGLGEYGGGIYD